LDGISAFQYEPRSKEKIKTDHIIFLQMCRNSGILALRLNPVMINNSGGIIQSQECSNVVSACHILNSVQVSFQRKINMIITNMNESCKYQMLWMGVTDNFTRIAH